MVSGCQVSWGKKGRISRIRGRGEGGRVAGFRVVKLFCNIL